MFVSTKTKALICGFIISVLLSFVNFAGKCDKISEKVFRLHIIANSDSRDDQELKLKVRDRILNDFGKELMYIEDLETSKKIVECNLEKIRAIAKEEIEKNGYDYEVSACITDMYFDTRKYGKISLPAGYYNAVRITIGNANGKNWWCVMFPPMCVPAAKGEHELENVLENEEKSIVFNETQYEARFKTLELFVEAEKFFQNNIFKPISNIISNFDFKYDFKISFCG
ncbi:MAG: stage II sporulation protein R [Clostridia bacterium]|nr:stage II sporulation protein R [Clostridia bacterium]